VLNDVWPIKAPGGTSGSRASRSRCPCTRYPQAASLFLLALTCQRCCMAIVTAREIVQGREVIAGGQFPVVNTATPRQRLGNYQSSLQGLDMWAWLVILTYFQPIRTRPPHTIPQSFWRLRSLRLPCGCSSTSARSFRAEIGRARLRERRTARFTPRNADNHVAKTQPASAAETRKYVHVTRDGFEDGPLLKKHRCDSRLALAGVVWCGAAPLRNLSGENVCNFFDEDRLLHS